MRSQLKETYIRSKEFLGKEIKHLPIEDTLLYCHAAIALISLPTAIAIQKLIFDEQDANPIKEFNVFASTALVTSSLLLVDIKCIKLLIEAIMELVEVIKGKDE